MVSWIKTFRNPYPYYYKEIPVGYLERMTLKDLENQLEHLPNFCKTHRSYLVNLGVVEQVNGNAQGLQLVIPGLEFSVPVSRTMIPVFEQQFTDK